MTITNLSFLGLKDLSTVETGTVAGGGGTESVTIQPPDGLIYELIGCGFYVQQVAAGGDGGVHDFRIGRGGSSIQNLIAKYASAYTSAITVYQSGIAQTADSSQYPDTDAAQAGILQNLYANYDLPLTVYYTNNATTADQTSNRNYDIFCKVYKEVL